MLQVLNCSNNCLRTIMQTPPNISVRWIHYPINKQPWGYLFLEKPPWLVSSFISLKLGLFLHILGTWSSCVWQPEVVPVVSESLQMQAVQLAASVTVLSLSKGSGCESSVKPSHPSLVKKWFGFAFWIFSFLPARLLANWLSKYPFSGEAISF